MSIKHIRFSQVARDQLSRLKRHTGIEHMNVIARWALCVSLSEEMPPPETKIPADSNLEMTWEVFGGKQGDTLLALVKQRCVNDGFDPFSEEVVYTQFRLHVHRGLAYLASDRAIRSISDLVSKALKAA
jgi:DNA sulfur modification protein DndE